MSRLFRHDLPLVRPGTITRPRLLHELLLRWERRLTVVVGGPGFGKTTLLAQAIAENRLAPHGEDVWLGASPHDADAAELAAALLDALGGEAGLHPDVATVADAVWARSPAEVCLVVDDVHLIPEGSGGLELLTALLDELPANGHLLVAGRTPPRIPFARLAAQGLLARVLEDSLRFDDDEIEAFAVAHDAAPHVVRASGGWPALAELAVSADEELSRDYLWQEVLAPMDDHRRLVLATLIDLGGADQELASAALDEQVDLTAAIEGVPLVAIDAAGWFTPHSLWSTAPAISLPPTVRRSVRQRAATLLVERHRFADAFDLLAGTELWDDVARLMVVACGGHARVTADQLHGWLERCPDHVVESPAGQLAVGVHTRLTNPGDAAPRLRAALESFHAVGDTEGEMSAISHLSHLAWWDQDRQTLREMGTRLPRLVTAGEPRAIGLSHIGAALAADIMGSDERALASLAAIPAGTLPAEWRAVVGWMEATQRLNLGDPDGALTVANDAIEVADSVFALTLRQLILQARWCRGEIAEVVEEYALLISDTEESGIAHNVVIVAASAAALAAFCGQTDLARQHLRRADAAAHHARDVAVVRLALARAALAVADGDEDTAAAILAEALCRHPFEQGAPRRAWRLAVGLLYVLLPSHRPAIDETALAPSFDRARRLGVAVVAARAGTPASWDVVDGGEITEGAIGRVRAALHYRHAGELAVALGGTAPRAASAILTAIDRPGRARVVELAGEQGDTGRAARGLLGRVPAPPSEPLDICVLGQLGLRRGGDLVDDRLLKRDRVRALLAYLVVRRQVTRGEAMAALWPEFDERSASNNLRVNLSHLERALEPHRGRGDVAWSVRHQGGTLELVTGPMVRVDVDELDAHLEAANAADRDGAPSVALDHLLAAVDLWRGEPFADVPDAEWLDLPRQHLRDRYVAAGLRAGQLLVGRGDHDAATGLANRLLTVDPWSEPAHGLIVSAALARGDRAAAKRALDRCHRMLDELGGEPSAETQTLARRIRAR